MTLICSDKKNGNKNAIGSHVSNGIESELTSQPLPLNGEEEEQTQQKFRFLGLQLGITLGWEVEPHFDVCLLN